MTDKKLWKDGGLKKIVSSMKKETYRIDQGMAAWKILILGDYRPPKKKQLLEKIRGLLRDSPHYLNAFLVDDLIEGTPEVNNITRMRHAIEKSDIILAVDGKTAGFAAECTYIIEKCKKPIKAILFLNKKSYPSIDAVLGDNDYKTLFPQYEFYLDENDLLNKCINHAKHRCKRLSMYSEARKGKNIGKRGKGLN